MKRVLDRSATLLKWLPADSQLQVPTLWALISYHHTASHRDAARAVAEQLVRVAESSGDRGLRATAATMIGITRHAEGNFTEAKEGLEQAIALYDRVRDRNQGAQMGLDSLVLAKTLLAHLRWFAGDTESAFELVGSAVAWAREVGHVPSLAIGLLYGCQVYQFAGDKAEAAKMTGEILSLAQTYGLPAFEGYAAIIHAWATGNAQQGEPIVRGLNAMGCKIALSYYASLMADELAERGLYEQAKRQMDNCLAMCLENDERYYEPELHRRRAVYQSHIDDSSGESRSSFETAARLARQQYMPRIEARAIRDLLARFPDDHRARERLDGLLNSNRQLL